MTEVIENQTANVQDMMAGSYIVTVDDYDTYSNPRLIDRSVFSEFAFKNGRFSDSAQLDMEEWGAEYKTPQYPLDFLAGLLNLNIYHEECCDMVSTYITKYGFDIKPVDGYKGEVDLDLRQEVINWIYSMPVSFLTMISEVGYDFEAIGCAGLEVIREQTPYKLIQYYKRFDVVHSKLCTDNIRLVQTVNGKKRYFLLYGYNQRRSDNEKVSVNKYTGEIKPYGSLSYKEEASEVIWITKYKTGNNNYGSAKISKALDVIESEIGRSSFNRKFFQNYGLPAFVVTVTGNFKDYEKERYLEDGTLNPDFDETKTLKYIVGEQLKQMIKEPHSAMVLTIPTSSNFDNEVNVTITPLSTDVKEASFRLLRSDNKNDICASHGMSSDIIGTTQTGNLGGTSLETDLNSFKSDKIRPMQIIIEEAINPSIYERFNTNVLKFVLLNSNAEDKDKKLERVLKLGNAGLMTRREQLIELGNGFGVNSNADNDYLDEYLINGRTEEEVFELYSYSYNPVYNRVNNDTLQGTISNKGLDSLEDELLKEAYRLWCEDGENNTVSIKSQAKKRIPPNIQRIITNYFKPRGNTSK